MGILFNRLHVQRTTSESALPGRLASGLKLSRAAAVHRVEASNQAQSAGSSCFAAQCDVVIAFKI